MRPGKTPHWPQVNTISPMLPNRNDDALIQSPSVPSVFGSNGLSQSIGRYDGNIR